MINNLADLLLSVIGAVIAYFITRALQSRPKLVSRVVHSSSFIANDQEEPPVIGYSYTLLLANSGRKTANNVRISHKILPEVVEIHPDINYSTETLPGGSTDIIIPTLAPGQWVQIAYRLFSPTTWEDLIGIIRSDECFVKEIEFPWLVKHPTIEKVTVILLFFISIFGLIKLTPGLLSHLSHFISALIALLS